MYMFLFGVIAYVFSIYSDDAFYGQKLLKVAKNGYTGEWLIFLNFCLGFYVAVIGRY